jgi:hypothetical protein
MQEPPLDEEPRDHVLGEVVLRSASRARLAGDEQMGEKPAKSATISPKTSTGRAIRQGLKPVPARRRARFRSTAGS